MDQVDSYVTSVFKEFNELGLIHESKLGQTFKDMQQFLKSYESCDEDARNLLNKINMIIDIQEKKMYLEIFGDNKLEMDQLAKITNKKGHRHSTDMPPPSPTKHFSSGKKLENPISSKNKHIKDSLKEEGANPRPELLLGAPPGAAPLPNLVQINQLHNQIRL
jgi:hypothetical protein